MSFVVKRLAVKNFRGFENEAYTFSPEFSAVVGNNGRGKTTVLDAVGMCCANALAHFNAIADKDPTSQDVRRVTFQKQQQLHVEQQFPLELIATFDYLGKAHEIGIEVAADAPIIKSSIFSETRNIKQQVSGGANIVLPLFAYYGAGRRWIPSRKKEDVQKPASRLSGYRNSLSPSASLDALLAWMKTRELIQLQEGEPDALLDLCKQAIVSCVEHAEEVRYNIRQGELLLTLRGCGETQCTLPFDMLSDGQKNMLATVADIAWRAGTLNPHLGVDALAKTPGVVLIDELDLHLHPRWQRRVVEDLRSTFPCIQFIVSTHSPFILQSLEPGELVDLNPGDSGEYAGQSIEDIAEEVMRVSLPQRSRKHQEMVRVAEKYYALIEKGRSSDEPEVEKIKQKLDALTAPFSDNPAYVAMLNMKRLAAGMESSDTEADE